MPLGTLSLHKDGDPPPAKLTLGLTKDSLFRAELHWESQHDIDVHAFLLASGQVTAMERVLSTYNCRKTNKQGVLPANPDGSFATPEGAIFHSPDELQATGEDVDEFIKIDGSKMPPDVNEVPIFVTIHPPEKQIKFSQVSRCGIRIKDAQDKTLGDYVLSNQFGEFQGVQIGSFLYGEGGWAFVEVARGFHGDLNTILGQFS